MMKYVTIVLLCCSALLFACDRANDAGSGIGAAKDTVSDAVDPGESIYKSRCAACHGTGVAGAPRLGDKTAWANRIAQGNATLLQHAIEGFKGDKGYMPPKGGYLSLSDEEIAITVQYMVTQSQ